MKIIISGTPGTGKTTLAKRLSKALKYEHLLLKPIIKRISDGYDFSKQCYVVDVKDLNKEVIKVVKGKKDVIIANHLIHNLPARYVDLCIITKCSNLLKLKKRLEDKKYKKKKVEENIQCEIFDICLEQARKKKHNVLVVDTCSRFSIKNLVDYIKSFPS